MTRSTIADVEVIYIHRTERAVCVRADEIDLSNGPTYHGLRLNELARSGSYHPGDDA